MSMLESASMAYVFGLTLAFLGFAGLIVCIGIFAARVGDHLNELDDATWHR